MKQPSGQQVKSESVRFWSPSIVELYNARRREVWRASASPAIFDFPGPGTTWCGPGLDGLDVVSLDVEPDANPLHVTPDRYANPEAWANIIVGQRAAPSMVARWDGWL